jgi:hypothetical protein
MVSGDLEGWGVQEASAVLGVADVVVPSPSGLKRMGASRSWWITIALS